jgi:prepilin peptidase CpaA
MIPAVVTAELVPLISFCPILLMVAAFDLKQMRIPNVLVVAGALMFVFCLPFLEFPEALTRIAICAGAFVICVGLFAFRWMGGGDTKMIPVVFLFIPSNQASLYMMVFGFSLLTGIALVSTLRARLRHNDATWASMRPGAQFPMGVSIALSGLIFLGLSASQ